MTEKRYSRQYCRTGSLCVTVSDRALDEDPPCARDALSPISGITDDLDTVFAVAMLCGSGCQSPREPQERSESRVAYAAPRGVRVRLSLRVLVIG